MFDSQDPADKLPCGHMAHLSCINRSAVSSNQICSLCCATSSSNSRAAAGPCYEAVHGSRMQLSELKEQLGAADELQLTELLQDLTMVSPHCNGQHILPQYIP